MSVRRRTLAIALVLTAGSALGVPAAAAADAAPSRPAGTISQLIAAEIPLINSVASDVPVLQTIQTAPLNQVMPGSAARNYQAAATGLLRLMNTKYSTKTIEASKNVSTVKHLSAQWTFVDRTINDLVHSLQVAIPLEGGVMTKWAYQFADQAAPQLDDLAEKGIDVSAARAALKRVVPEAQPGTHEATVRFNALAAADFSNHGKVVRLQFQIGELFGTRVFYRLFRDVTLVENLIESNGLSDETSTVSLVGLTRTTTPISALRAVAGWRRDR